MCVFVLFAFVCIFVFSFFRFNSELSQTFFFNSLPFLPFFLVFCLLSFSFFLLLLLLLLLFLFVFQSRTYLFVNPRRNHIFIFASKRQRGTAAVWSVIFSKTMSANCNDAIGVNKWTSLHSIWRNSHSCTYTSACTCAFIATSRNECWYLLRNEAQT